MNDLSAHLRIMLRVFYIWLAGCLMVWAVFPSFKTYSAGLILGSSVSFLNALFLGRKVHFISETVVQQKAARINIGFLSRICFMLLAVMVVIKFPQFDLLFTMIGFMFAPLTAFIVGFAVLHHKRH